jgi:hypothetical protein
VHAFDKLVSRNDASMRARRLPNRRVVADAIAEFAMQRL